jgi:hypothetical protein
MLQKLDLFLPSGEGQKTTTLLGPVESANLSHVVCQFLEFWMMDKVQNPSNSECYTPSSESFKF